MAEIKAQNQGLSITGIKKRYQQSNFRKILQDKFGLLGFILILFLVLLAVFAPLIAPYGINEIDVMNKLSAPSASNLFGTDHLGRDTFSRIIMGSRIVLLVSISTTAFGVFLAIILGVLSGYASDRVGNTLLIFFDIIKSFPALLFAITVLAFTGPSIINLILIIGITRFPGYARLIRAQTLRAREKEYVMAANAIGASPIKVMYKHILPNVIGPVFIQAAMDIPVVITFEAVLSFLGLGTPPPTPSWGSILRVGYSYIRTSPWLVIFGGLALIVATLGFTLFGEALRDNFDPKLRKNY
ncbi:MAG: ABC transporter permease [Halanaerobiales bacterium]